MRINHYFNISCVVLCMLLFPTFHLQADIYYDYAGGVYYQPNNDGTTAAIANPNGDGDYQGNIIIPSTITNDYTGTTYTVTSILGSAFEDSPELLSVTIPSTVTEIGAWAFSDCPKMTRLTINGGIATIGNDLFKGTNIEELTLGSEVTSIKNLGLNPATIISYAVTPPECDESTFTGYDAVLTVPEEGYNDYLTADYWSNFFVADAISLNEDNVTLYVGEIHTLIATVYSVNLKDPHVVWTSSDESVATVDDNGNITAVGVGECDITATCQNVSATCHVTVQPVLPESITLNSENEDIFIGDTFQLIATILPENTTDKTVTWTSSNENIATVDENGLVTAVGVGECDITATCQNVTATCHFSVLPILPVAITLNTEDASILIGNTFQLTATVIPENTTDKTVTWASSDENIATVDENGLVTAVGVGECDITVTCQNVSATCHITVLPIRPESITLNTEEASVLIGNTFQLTATVLPENTSDKTVNWTSSDENIATVDENGLVTAVFVGNCDITATCQNVSATCHITVLPILPESISQGLDSAMIKQGNSIQLSAYILPENTTDKTVTWATSDESIATVDASGLVTTLIPGECDITATCQSLSATCHITVIDPADISIQFVAPEITSCLKNKAAINFTMYPIPTELRAESSDTTVAVVQIEDNALTIEGLGIGYTDIIIGSQDGLSQSDTCRVSIYTHVGDANGTGSTTIADVTFLIDILLSNQPYNYLADANADGRNAIDDVTILIDMLLNGQDYFELIAPESLTLSQQEVNIPIEGSATLTATVEPENVYNSVVSWESTNNAIATVNNGVITAKGIGSCDIIAKCLNAEDVCHVTVYEIKPESVTLDHSNEQMHVGEQLTLTATVSPSNVTNPTITWTSTNRSIARVVNGVVSAVGIGECDIIATCQDKQATCHITVVEVLPESVTLDHSNEQMHVGDQLTLTATVSPSNVTNPKITWSTTNRSVATVTNGLVKAIGIGECDIIATCQDKQATCHITVVEVLPQSVTLNYTNKRMSVGDKVTLTATVSPSNVTNPTITWSTTNQAIATVANGVVTAVAVGECDIKATCQNVSATCHITVQGATTSGEITVNGVTFVMVPVQGGTFTMGISIQGDASTDNKIQHEVTLSDFAIGQTEVTQELWVAVMNHNPSINEGNPQYPVEYVTWEETQTFIATLNDLTGLHFRLPTEAEWEYAARGGQLSQGYKYSGSNTLYDVAWCNGNSGGTIHPVKQKAANELGLYDMTGNVKEWTNDWYAYYTSAAQTNPTGPATGSWKVFRGGSYDSKAAECYVTKRASREVTFHTTNLGLRLVLVP